MVITMLIKNKYIYKPINVKVKILIFIVASTNLDAKVIFKLGLELDECFRSDLRMHVFGAFLFLRYSLLD